VCSSDLRTQSGTPSTLLGFNVYLTEEMPNTIACFSPIKLAEKRAVLRGF